MNICVVGAAGRMGSLIALEIINSSKLNLVGAIEAENSPFLGKDIGDICKCDKTGINITSNILDIAKKADIIIDFSGSKGTKANLDNYSKLKKPLVIGSTALDDSTVKSLENMSKNFPLVLSPNMSIGVNLLFKLTEIVAKTLKEGFDIEIVEAHHNMKKDAPSGTAMKLANIIKDINSLKENDIIYGRKGDSCVREKNQLCVHAIRGGDIVGDHTVMFCGLGERLELTHRASSRNTFVKGAIKAALWIKEKEPGLYNMYDVLNLNI
ncbi:MAG: 4-hydroxy-tetrahydrodipicolinate reductase [Deferribacterota bacterium]|nr:4-hydroxy-tetrahydrodipicolinate reductase [Deferribacterota bacterium]